MKPSPAPLATTPSHEEFPALGRGPVRKSPHTPRPRLETPVPATPGEQTLTITNTDLKDMFMTFAEALVGMLGHTVDKDKLQRVTNNALNTYLTKKPNTPTRMKLAQTQASAPIAGTTPATAAIEPEKKAFGLHAATWPDHT